MTIPTSFDSTDRKFHLSLAKKIWLTLLGPSDIAIDATCGNGHDTLALASILTSGRVFAIDIQPEAIANTCKRLTDAGCIDRVKLLCRTHSSFPEEIFLKSVGLIVYNLGYLPGGDKNLTTGYETTLKSIESGKELLKPLGAFSITLYPGHAAGAQEKSALLAHCKTFPTELWTIHHFERASPCAPSLLMIQKKLAT